MISKKNITTFLIDLLLGIVVLIVIIGTFGCATSATVDSQTKPSAVAWNAEIDVNSINNRIHTEVNGSLYTQIVDVELSGDIVVDDGEVIEINQDLYFVLFHTLGVSQNLHCDIILDTCSICVEVPSIWPTEICFDDV